MSEADVSSADSTESDVGVGKPRIPSADASPEAPPCPAAFVDTTEQTPAEPTTTRNSCITEQRENKKDIAHEVRPALRETELTSREKSIPCHHGTPVGVATELLKMPAVSVPSGVVTSSVELDERVALYCQCLAMLSSLFRQLAGVGCAQVLQGQVVRRVDIVLCTLDRVARLMLERTAQVESKRQTVLQLTDNVAVSGHAVEARAMELADDERERAYMEHHQARKVSTIHKLTLERRNLERCAKPKLKALQELLDVLAEKEECLRRLQHIQDLVQDHCVQDMVWLEKQAKDAEQMVARWQNGDKLDMEQELEQLGVDEDALTDLQQEVTELKNQLHHLQTWGGEALQDKLLYCSRSRQIKQKTQLTEHMLSFASNQAQRGDSEHAESYHNMMFPASGDHDPSVSDSQRASDLLLADGAPKITARQVEQYLSQQFGFEVCGHYLMFSRLKEELGAVGLAYLAHKVRDGGSLRKDAANPELVSAFPDPAELRRVLLVLQDIAFQFRADQSLTASMLVPLTLEPVQGPVTASSRTASSLSSKPSQKRAKSKNRSGNSQKQAALPHDGPTPDSSKVKIESRSSFSRLKRAFGIHKKSSSQHAGPA